MYEHTLDDYVQGIRKGWSSLDEDDKQEIKKEIEMLQQQIDPSVMESLRTAGKTSRDGSVNRS